MTAWLLALALSVEPMPSALTRAAAGAADQALAAAPVGSAVGVWVTAATPELAQATGSALIDALRSRGAKSVVLVQSSDAAAAESAAQAQGLDLLLRLRAGLEGTELTLAGDRIDTWVNFWDGATVQRELPSALVAARAPADATALTLARVVLSTPPPPPPKLGLELLGSVPSRVVALALVDADGDGHPEIAALTPEELLILKRDGTVVARRDHASLPRSARPVRAPCGGLVSPAGAAGHRLLYAFANQARGEAVLVDGSGLHPVGLLDGVPLASGAAGTLSAANANGTDIFGPEVKLGAASHVLARPFFALAANPGVSAPAFLASFPEGQVQPLSAALEPLGPMLTGGIGALADLDGDGKPELILSGPQPLGESDHLRVLELAAPADSTPRSVFEADVPGGIVAATSGDLNGDGKPDAILAALQPDGTTRLVRVGVTP